MTSARKFFLLPILAAVVSVAVAHAQTAPADSTAIKVQPALFQQVVNPGDTFSTEVTVTNPDPTPKQFTVSVENISGLNAAGQPVFTTSTNADYGISSWVTVATPVISIPGNGSLNVPFTVNVPKLAAPGGHYGAIFITYGATRPLFTGTGIGYQVGSLLDFRIAGQADETAAVKEFTTDKNIYQSPNVSFMTDVVDTGNVLLRPRGPIDIMNMFGQKVGTIIMNDGNEAIFPSQDRTFTAQWTNAGFMMGRFDAVMSLTYGDNGQKTISQETSFWIIPVVPILAVLASILFFVFIFIWSVRAYIRRKLSAMAEGRHERAAQLSAEERFLAENRLPFSRLVFILIATAVFAIIFLMILFFFFG